MSDPERDLEIDGLESALALATAENRGLRERLERAEADMRDIRAVFPKGTCCDCRGFDFEVAEVNKIIDEFLAGGVST